MRQPARDVEWYRLAFFWCGGILTQRDFEARAY